MAILSLKKHSLGQILLPNSNANDRRNDQGDDWLHSRYILYKSSDTANSSILSNDFDHCFKGWNEGFRPIHSKTFPLPDIYGGWGMSSSTEDSFVVLELAAAL